MNKTGISLPTYSDYHISEDGIYKRHSKSSFVRICNYMEILSIEQNIDTTIHSAKIAYDAFGEINSITVPRSTYLQRRKLLDLQNQGLDVTEENASLLVNYFKEDEESKANTIHCTHSSLGFGIYKGKQIFKHYNAIGVDSTYNGPYDIKPSGSYKTYMKMVSDEILGNPVMETVLIAGLSSVLLAYLSVEYSLDSLIIHIASDSTKGKTTGIKVAASLHSNPLSREGSLFATFHGTHNALIEKLSGLNGIPYFLDEISVASMDNFTSFIYAITNGTGKERLNKDSQLKAKSSWITTIVSTGERSLVGSSSKNKGVAARVFEMKNCTVTRDAENAERIQSVISKNYGLVGPKYVEYILSLKKDEICKRFEEIREEFYESVKQNQSTDELFYRRTAKFAILLLTAEYFEKFSGLTLQKEEIKDFLTSIELESTRTRNFHDSVISYIKDYISINAAAFGLQGSGNTMSYGKITARKGYTEALFYKTAFDEMLSKGRYEDSSIVLKELKANGYLDCETDRFTRSRKNHNGIRQDVYVLKLTDYPLNEQATNLKIEGDEENE